MCGFVEIQITSKDGCYDEYFFSKRNFALPSSMYNKRNHYFMKVKINRYYCSLRILSCKRSMASR